MTAIVTGGTKGIGLGVTRMLVRKGYRVIVSYAHDDEAALHLQNEYPDSVLIFKADHSVRKQTYSFVHFIRQHTSTVNCVVLNAGMTIRKAFTEMLDNDWDYMMEVAVNSSVILLRELYNNVADCSRIIFTGSTMAIYPHATVLGYGVTKSAIHSLAKNLVKVFEPKQTTVNVIAPGFVETEWQKNKPEEIRQHICAKTAVHRFCSVDEVVKSYEFCLENDFVNGSVIEVNGGYSYQ